MQSIDTQRDANFAVRLKKCNFGENVYNIICQEERESGFV